MLINFFVMATPFTSEYSVMGAVSCLICPLLRVRADLSLYLHRSKDSTPSEQIEGHLPEEGIGNILDYPVRLQITRELEKIPVLVQLAFRGVSLFPLLLDLFVADGMTGKLNQAVIHGNSLVDG